MILETEQLLEKRLEQLSTNENRHFYLGFKECLGLFKIAIHKSDQYNLYIENKRLKDELYRLKSYQAKFRSLEQQLESKKVFRSNFAKDILSLLNKDSKDVAINHLESAIIN